MSDFEDKWSFPTAKVWKLCYNKDWAGAVLGNHSGLNPHKNGMALQAHLRGAGFECKYKMLPNNHAGLPCAAVHIYNLNNDAAFEAVFLAVDLFNKNREPAAATPSPVAATPKTAFSPTAPAFVPTSATARTAPTAVAAAVAAAPAAPLPPPAAAPAATKETDLQLKNRLQKELEALKQKEQELTAAFSEAEKAIKAKNPVVKEAMANDFKLMSATAAKRGIELDEVLVDVLDEEQLLKLLEMKKKILEMKKKEASATATTTATAAAPAKGTTPDAAAAAKGANPKGANPKGDTAKGDTAKGDTAKGDADAPAAAALWSEEMEESHPCTVKNPTPAEAAASADNSYTGPWVEVKSTQ